MGLPAFGAMQLVFATGLVAAFAHGPLAFILLTALLTPYDLLSTAHFALAYLRGAHGLRIVGFAEPRARGIDDATLLAACVDRRLSCVV